MFRRATERDKCIAYHSDILTDTKIVTKLRYIDTSRHNKNYLRIYRMPKAITYQMSRCIDVMMSRCIDTFRSIGQCVSINLVLLYDLFFFT
jgi:hypothetical protein